MKPLFSYMALFFYTVLCLSCHRGHAPQGAASVSPITPQETASINLLTQQPLAPINLEVKDQSGNLQLSGKASRSRLQQPPYGDWFNKNYDSYHVDSAMVGKLRTGLAGRRLMIFMGTWCGDSRREVPRFEKLMDCCGIDPAAVDIVTVSNSDSMYKQSPGHEERGHDVFRVPSFIVLEKGHEIGRIVESPVNSLEKDLLSIVSGEPYTPHYQGGALLAGIFRREKVEKVKKHLPELTERLRPLVSSSGELSSYAKVLQAAGQPEKAGLVRDLNTRLFPAGK